MKYLFIDTETTGLSCDIDSSPMEFEKWPRLVSVAYILTDDKKVLSDNYHIVKPKNFIIPLESTRIHGISTAKAISEGEDISFVLSDFKEKLALCDFVVGHNVEYDINVLNAEYYRKEKDLPVNLRPSICTMKGSANICNLPNKKYPKLEELYYLLKGEKMSGAHNALVDTKAAMDCFWILKDTSMLDLQKSHHKAIIYPVYGNVEYVFNKVKLDDDFICKLFALFALACALNEHENFITKRYYVKNPNSIKLIERPEPIYFSRFKEFTYNTDSETEWLERILELYEQSINSNNYVKRLVESLKKMQNEVGINKYIKIFFDDLKKRFSEYDIKTKALFFLVIHITYNNKEKIYENPLCKDYLRELIAKINKSREEQILKNEKKRMDEIYKTASLLANMPPLIEDSKIEEINSNDTDKKGCFILILLICGFLPFIFL